MANIDNAYTVSRLSLNDNALIVDGNFDPSTGAGYEAPVGSLFIRTDNASVYQKTGATDTDWTLSSNSSVAKKQLFRHNGAVTQTFTTTPVNVLFDTNVRMDTVFTYNNGVVTFTEAGWYDIASDVSINNNNNNETVAQMQFLLNGSAVAGTLSYLNSRNTSNGRATTTSHGKINVAANNTLSVSLVRATGNGAPTTVANACRLIIQQIDGP
jgi:hypothetical protein